LTVPGLSKKLLKITAFILGGIIALLIAFHFWFVHHAEELVAQLVSNASKGKLKLEVQKFKFNWFSKKMELRKAVFYTTDSTAPVSYRFNVKTIRLQVKEVLPLIFDKQMRFDSIHLIAPDVVVTKMRSVRNGLNDTTSLSLPQEMGRVYNSIQDALQILQVNRFQVEEGKFTLINKTKPEDVPVAVTNLFLRLDNFAVDSAGSDKSQKILFSENVIVNTHHQDIAFPDGRHRLSFSNFHADVRNRVAEFDSCTISAIKADSSNASFSIFIDKLRMTNIDFDTLYHAERIKADSVYCINPKFKLDINLTKKKANVIPPRLDEIVQQLTGDMQLAVVSVQNGAFDITTTREGRPSSFTSDHNNFELQGLQIKKNAPRAVVVNKFEMAIHNYENFLKDSTYAIQFDSILISNNRISLSNFAYKELNKNNKAINSIAMRQFELRGLSWDNLVFNQQLDAQNVILYQPVINYDFTHGAGKKDVFETLEGIGDILQLDNLDIIEGKVNLLFKNNIKIQLDKADLFIKGKELVNASSSSSIRRSVTGMNFKKGILTTPSLTAELHDIRFTGKDHHLTASSMDITKKDGTAINASGVTIEQMLIDDNLQKINLKGLRWNKANVVLASTINKSSAKEPQLIFDDINVKNTQVTTKSNDADISAFLQSIQAKQIAYSNNQLQTNQLLTNATNLSWQKENAKLTIDKLSIADNQHTTATTLRYLQATATDTLQLLVPSLQWKADINSLLNDQMNFDEITITNPDIQIVSNSPDNKSKTQNIPANFSAKKIRIDQPQINYSATTNGKTTTFEWNRNDDKNFLLISMLLKKPEGFTAEQLQFNASNFIFNPAGKKSFNAGNGRLISSMHNLKIEKNDIDEWEWQAIIDNLQATNFILDTIDNKNGKLSILNAELNGLSIRSSYLLNIRELIKKNPAFTLQKVNGEYINEKDRIEWFNAGYNKRTRFLTADSIFYKPIKTKEEYIAAQPYQADYTYFNTGKISIGPFDIDTYITDTAIRAGSVSVTNAYLSSYRDKRKPLQEKIIKNLPAQTLQKLPVHISIDSLLLKNALVNYEEFNNKTNAAGTVSVNQLNGTILNVKNYGLRASDSIYIIASAKIQDSIFTNLSVAQSYTDTAEGFVLAVGMRSADIRVLNPVLIPLASVELKSGRIDTLFLYAIGNNDRAYGKISMPYNNLKVKLYKNTDGRLAPSTGISNFLLNLLLKSKNKSKEHPIYFERWKNRSVMNYIVKITMTGARNSIGFKANKKELRQYRKNIKEIELSPTP